MSQCICQELRKGSIHSSVYMKGVEGGFHTWLSVYEMS